MTACFRLYRAKHIGRSNANILTVLSGRTARLGNHDLGSPNTAHITKEFFEQLGVDLSYARERRPTDNSITERFFGTVKQEEAYLVGSYPDEMSTKEEIAQLRRFIPPA